MQEKVVETRSDELETTPPGPEETKKPLVQPPIRKWLLRLALALLFVGATYGAVLLVQPNILSSRPSSKATPTQVPTRVNTPTPLPTTAQVSTLSKPLIQTTPVQTKVPPQEVDVGLNYSMWGGHRASMQIADGVLYTATVHNKVYALRLSDGELLWSFTMVGPSEYSPPYVERGICYVSALTYNKDRDQYTTTIYALNTSDGKLLWQYSQKDSYLSGVNNGIVFLSNEKTVLALRGSDGKELWRYSDEKAPISRIVDIVDGIAYIESLADGWAFSHGLVAVRATTGEQLWSNRDYNKNGQSYLFQRVSGNTIYASNSLTEELIALNTHDGKVRWSQKIGERGAVLDGVSNGLVFASSWDSPYHASSGMGGRIGTASALIPDFFAQPLLPAIPYKPAKITLYVLNESDGTILWQRGLTGDALGMNTQHKLINGVLYTSIDIAPLPDEENPRGGKLFAFESKTGRLLWEQTLDHEPGYGNMSIKDQTMYVAANDGGIYALRLSDGALIWHQPMKGYFYGDQLRVGDLIYVSDGNGVIYALDAQKGSLHWQYQTEIPKT